MGTQGSSLLYMVGLTLIPGIGDVNGKRLLAWCGSPEAVFRESPQRLRKIPGIGGILANAVKSSNVLVRADEELTFCRKEGIQVIDYLHDSYPTRLKECEDGPMVLYVRGNPPLNSKRILAVVGTRMATSYGLGFCQNLVKGLSSYGIMIVSGLAYGIDAEAHRAAVSQGLPTLAVLAHGLDRIYPYNHFRLARKMLEKGGLVTDFMSKEIPEKVNFPKRNRIIAGLSDAIVVVEAASTGGALITAEIGNSYNRDVFAVPGRIGDTYSEGCLSLIKNNKAALITSHEDVIKMMNWDTRLDKGTQARLFPALDPIEQKVMDIITPAGAHIDTITIGLSMHPGKVSSLMLEMEFKGLVRVLPGNRFAPVDAGRHRSGI